RRGVDREHEAALLQRTERSVEAARALGRDPDVDARVQHVAGLAQAVDRAPPVLPVDADDPRGAHRLSPDRYAEELLLRDEAERARNGGGDDRNVEQALMVGHDDVRARP